MIELFYYNACLSTSTVFDVSAEVMEFTAVWNILTITRDSKRLS